MAIRRRRDNGSLTRGCAVAQSAAGHRFRGRTHRQARNGRETRARNPALTRRHTELKTVGDPPCTLDEMRRRFRRTKLVRGRLENGDPAIEMLGRDRKLKMRLHWL